MEKLNFIIAAFILLALASFAESQVLFSAGSSGTDYGKDLAVDSQRNIIVAGYFTATVDFNPAAGVNNLTSVGNVDNFVAKYDANGNYVWAFSFGSLGVDIPHSVSVDSQNNIVVTGYFSGTTDFDPSPNVVNRTSAGSRDYYIAKYSASGAFLWVVAFGNTDDDQGLDVAIDASGNVYATGFFAGTVDVDAGSGTANLISVGNTDTLVAKYDQNGNYQWAFNLGSAAAEQGVGITTSDGGEVFVSGFFNQTIDFDPGAGVANRTSAGATDIYYAKYTTGGAFVWANAVGGTQADFAIPGGIFRDAGGNIHVNGNFRGTADFDPGANSATRASNGDADFFVGKYNANGDYIWALSVGGSLGDNAHRLTVDAGGNVYVTGWFGATADFDPSPNTQNLTAAGTDGALDIYFAKYDANGNYLWARGVGAAVSGAANWSLGTAIAPDGAGNYVLTGRFFGAADFDPSANNRILTSAGDADFFVAKYTPDGFLAVAAQSSAAISGRIATVNSFSTRLVTVTITNASGTITRTTRTNAKGLYRFIDLPTNETYTVTPSRAGLVFNPSAQTLSLFEDRMNVNFTSFRP